MNKVMRTLGPAMILLGLSVMAYGQPGRPGQPGPPGGGWQYLGEATVNGAVDHDNIMVTARQGTFRAIQIRVDNAAVQFNRVIVHYGNGQSAPIQIRSRIQAGGQTRAIDLPGQRRIIQRVEFFYQRANWGLRRPKVRLFGLS